MGDPATAREALLAELIGDIAQLLDRVDKLVPTMDGSRQKFLEAARALTVAMEPFDVRMQAFASNAAGNAVQHIARRTSEIARDSLEEQKRSMREAARVIFQEEVGAAFRRLDAAIKPIVEKSKRPWDTWLTHAAAAVISGVFSAAAVTYLLVR